ncbi:hypothetical protein CYMTET_44254 [Cymbomonas tetramitiformis]|uniref:Uncharacterized protein n=1 Tax=Cymbomonas tetramitiformis TaxID=36881 RepID=A0AAE0EZ83_9CHLO|nr:hypothetical protein CYMTET_44254 [Cymbomonas tetramitiformis]
MARDGAYIQQLNGKVAGTKDRMHMTEEMVSGVAKVVGLEGILERRAALETSDRPLPLPNASRTGRISPLRTPPLTETATRRSPSGRERSPDRDMTDPSLGRQRDSSLSPEHEQPGAREGPAGTGPATGLLSKPTASTAYTLEQAAEARSMSHEGVPLECFLSALPLLHPDAA